MYTSDTVQRMNSRATRVGTFEVCVPTRVARFLHFWSQLLTMLFDFLCICVLFFIVYLTTLMTIWLQECSDLATLVPTHVALRKFIMRVLASQLHFLTDRNADLTVPPLLWPVDIIKIGVHVEQPSGPTVHSLYCASDLCSITLYTCAYYSYYYVSIPDSCHRIMILSCSMVAVSKVYGYFIIAARIIRNCTYLLPNKRLTHTVKI